MTFLKKKFDVYKYKPILKLPHNWFISSDILIEKVIDTTD